MAKFAMIFAASLVALLVVMEPATIAFASPADVNIYNQLGESIRMHCQSGDRDLKKITLPDAQSFGWGFTPNIWGRTLFFCSFRWGARTQIFDVWTEKYQECVHCVWLVRKDGFWRNVEGQNVIKLVHPWL